MPWCGGSGTLSSSGHIGAESARRGTSRAALRGELVGGSGTDLGRVFHNETSERKGGLSGETPSVNCGNHARVARGHQEHRFASQTAAPSIALRQGDGSPLTRRTGVRYSLRTHVPSTGRPPPGYRLRSGRRRPALRRRGEARGLCGEADGHSLVDRGHPLCGRPAAGDLGAPAAQPPAQHDTRTGAAVGFALVGGFGAKKEAGPLVFGQIDSRSALAAACRRSLTSASSRAARSMRSCWTSVRSCWLLARSCWRSARSRTSLSWLAISCTVRVRSASCPATLAMSCSAVTPSYPILWGETRRGGLVAAPPPLLLLGGFGGITGEREPLRLRHNVQLVSLEAWQERPEKQEWRFSSW